MVHFPPTNCEITGVYTVYTPEIGRIGAHPCHGAPANSKKEDHISTATGSKSQLRRLATWKLGQLVGIFSWGYN